MNRCHHDIINELLVTLVTEPRKITELCAAVNIPVDRGKDVIRNLERFGLLFEMVGDGEVEYRITDRGYEWIGLYKHLKRALP